jgi:dienelactone hydrolase
MICLENNSDTVIIVLHEIYGINRHITAACDRLSRGKYDILCPNLLAEGQPSFSYSQEQAAYRNFMQNIGFSQAERQVVELTESIRQRYCHCFIVGFSAGATVGWLCSGHAGLYSGMAGFYGSRIRDFLEVEPKCPGLLFFPGREESYSVDALLPKLAVKEDVDTVKTAALHGFADPWSGRYHREASEECYARVTEFISRLR